ncbi:MAG: hypothetical protein V7L20_28465 [Nostoc sp.]
MIFGVAELKYESGCRDVAVLRLYKDFGIMQNHFHTWNQQRLIFEQNKQKQQHSSLELGS